MSLQQSVLHPNYSVCNTATHASQPKKHGYSSDNSDSGSSVVSVSGINPEFKPCQDQMQQCSEAADNDIRDALKEEMPDSEVPEENNSSESSEYNEDDNSQDYLQEISYEESSFSNERNFSSQINEAFDYFYYAVLQEKEKTIKEKDCIDSEKEQFSTLLSKEMNVYTSDLQNFDENCALLKQFILCSNSDIIEFELRNNVKIVTSLSLINKFPNSKLSRLLKQANAKSTLTSASVTEKPNFQANTNYVGPYNITHCNFSKSLNNSLSFTSTIKNFSEKQVKPCIFSNTKETSKVSSYFSTMSQLIADKSPKRENLKSSRDQDHSVIIPHKCSGKYFVDRDSKIFGLLISFLRKQKLPYFIDRGQETSFYEELDFWGIPFPKKGKQ